jgi:isopentenyl-diphosphate delta-isomerase
MLKQLIQKSNTINIFKNKHLSTFPDKFKHYDQTQLTFLNEPCILVDEKDNIIGEATKKDCHLIEKMKKSKTGMLHRAFSVFIFDSNQRLLLHQRSLHKITFPNQWTNSCCSHPLSTELEKDSSNQIGIRRAARRRVSYELGIPESKIDLNSFNYITRVQYKADNIPEDGVFAENEIDYVLFLNGINYSIDNFNRNEIKAARYLTQYELKEFLNEEKSANSAVSFTPWFKWISERFLFKWWSQLDNIESIKDHNTIYKL